jgi:hypothetical protein
MAELPVRRWDFSLLSHSFAVVLPDERAMILFDVE